MLPSRGLISRTISIGVLSLVGIGFLTGCETKGLLDPTAVGRWKKEPLVVPILNNLDAAVEEANPEFLNATEVRQSDLVAPKTDYVIGPDDLLSVSITDLIAPGVESVKSTRVSTSGRISLPMVGQIQASGLTEAQLEQEIIRTYRDANLIPNAQVAVSVTEARNRTFSIIGAVSQPGQYAILKSDFRMLDALVLARDTTFPDLKNIYVIRHTKQANQQPATQPGEAANSPGSSERAKPQTGPVIPAPGDVAQSPANGELETTAATRQTASTAPTTQPTTDVWAQALNTGHTGEQATTQAFEFNAPNPPKDVRVIQVPLDKLKEGDLRYNIVIRPDDMIVVPPPVRGVYYMGGHVARVGVYDLTNRDITLKQAVVAAGMLDGLAIPARTEVIRRVGPSKEVFVRVNLDKIFAGEQPDIYLKPNDVVNVGTNAVAPFMAALRGAFRFTYGFGFLYDRNFASSANDNQ